MEIKDVDDIVAKVEDFYRISGLWTEEERDVQRAVRHFVDEQIKPFAGQWWQAGEFPVSLIPELGRLGVLGSNLPEEYGGSALSPLAYGLIMQELERGDSGLRSFASVQGALAMYAIYRYGSEEQRRQYLPAMASGQVIGCFGLTEPDAGSDPASMLTKAHQVGDDYVLSGTKRWITNGHLADIAIVWAKDDTGMIRGFIVPTDAPGFSARPIHTKASMRMSATSELYLDGVHVDKSLQLPHAKGLGAPLSCLTQARYGIAWGTIGAAMDCLVEAATYAKTRVAFGRSIAATQLVQERIVDMQTRLVSMQLMARQLGWLYQNGQLDYAHVSLAKRHNARAALEIARMSRELLGGNGISTDYASIRHMANLETVDTYEGTYEIHTLIVGRNLLGEEAF
ncbi:acyl-CoA dehydrogenase family protein [Sulfobacillus thermosulfidooxidans]|uniref:acyl-CoA dehydrogenase family protein n=1 Tax=Sulfobacillus thermosulfidooxidans TaxID=28034 RepID=UPI00096BC234|nr:acyl-CoA dehydrogenase family protein [Sulfobacillus thermosulfidooxidans]OLZ09620.1 acyl-CoA dehydrogenase [Sulfobacillus thermosulfidooxidans]OLZ16074.1 acyl-CoA dehydrogenase [Sulfobacillus thermosulfidooxidans]OLZ18078.1 acyl-CoA dehydrogenase [Sulfobacillus thermosulfidooxidans]